MVDQNNTRTEGKNQFAIKEPMPLIFGLIEYSNKWSQIIIDICWNSKVLTLFDYLNNWPEYYKSFTDLFAVNIPKEFLIFLSKRKGY